MTAKHDEAMRLAVELAQTGDYADSHEIAKRLQTEGYRAADLGLDTSAACLREIIMAKRIDSASHWRARAEEARKFAEQLSNHEKKQIMLAIAVSYITLAQLADEDRLTKGNSGHKPGPPTSDA